MSPKRPTNGQLYAKLEALEKIVKPLVPDVKTLMDDKHDRELIAKYLAANPPAPPSQQSQPGRPLNINQDLVKALGIALSVILGLVTLVISYHTVVTK